MSEVSKIAKKIVNNGGIKKSSSSSSKKSTDKTSSGKKAFKSQKYKGTTMNKWYSNAATGSNTSSTKYKANQKKAAQAKAEKIASQKKQTRGLFSKAMGLLGATGAGTSEARYQYNVNRAAGNGVLDSFAKTGQAWGRGAMASLYGKEYHDNADVIKYKTKQAKENGKVSMFDTLYASINGGYIGTNKKGKQQIYNEDGTKMKKGTGYKGLRTAVGFAEDIILDPLNIISPLKVGGTVLKGSGASLKTIAASQKAMQTTIEGARKIEKAESILKSAKKVYEGMTDVTPAMEKIKARQAVEEAESALKALKNKTPGAVETVEKAKAQTENIARAIQEQEATKKINNALPQMKEEQRLEKLSGVTEEQVKARLKNMPSMRGVDDDTIKEIAKSSVSSYRRNVMKLDTTQEELAAKLSGYSNVGFDKVRSMYTRGKAAVDSGLRTLGDKTIAPHYNQLLENIRTSKLGQSVSRTNQIEAMIKGNLKERGTGEQIESLDWVMRQAINSGEITAAGRSATLAKADKIQAIVSKLTEDEQMDVLRKLEDGTYKKLKEGRKTIETIGEDGQKVTETIEDVLGDKDINETLNLVRDIIKRNLTIPDEQYRYYSIYGRKIDMSTPETEVLSAVELTDMSGRYEDFNENETFIKTLSNILNSNEVADENLTELGWLMRKSEIQTATELALKQLEHGTESFSKIMTNWTKLVGVDMAQKLLDKNAVYKMDALRAGASEVEGTERVVASFLDGRVKDALIARAAKDEDTLYESYSYMVKTAQEIKANGGEVEKEVQDLIDLVEEYKANNGTTRATDVLGKLAQANRESIIRGRADTAEGYEALWDRIKGRTILDRRLKGDKSIYATREEYQEYEALGKQIENLKTYLKENKDTVESMDRDRISDSIWQYQQRRREIEDTVKRRKGITNKEKQELKAKVEQEVRDRRYEEAVERARDEYNETEGKAIAKKYEDRKKEIIERTKYELQKEIGMQRGTDAFTGETVFYESRVGKEAPLVENTGRNEIKNMMRSDVARERVRQAEELAGKEATTDELDLKATFESMIKTMRKKTGEIKVGADDVYLEKDVVDFAEKIEEQIRDPNTDFGTMVGELVNAVGKENASKVLKDNAVYKTKEAVKTQAPKREVIGQTKERQISTKEKIERYAQEERQGWEETSAKIEQFKKSGEVEKEKIKTDIEDKKKELRQRRGEEIDEVIKTKTGQVKELEAKKRGYKTRNSSSWRKADEKVKKLREEISELGKIKAIIKDEKKQLETYPEGTLKYLEEDKVKRLEELKKKQEGFKKKNGKRWNEAQEKIDQLTKELDEVRLSKEGKDEISELNKKLKEFDNQKNRKKELAKLEKEQKKIEERVDKKWKSIEERRQKREYRKIGYEEIETRSEVEQYMPQLKDEYERTMDEAIDLEIAKEKGNATKEELATINERLRELNRKLNEISRDTARERERWQKTKEIKEGKRKVVSAPARREEIVERATQEPGRTKEEIDEIKGLLAESSKREGIPGKAEADEQIWERFVSEKEKRNFEEDKALERRRYAEARQEQVPDRALDSIRRQRAEDIVSYREDYNRELEDLFAERVKGRVEEMDREAVEKRIKEEMQWQGATGRESTARKYLSDAEFKRYKEIRAELDKLTSEVEKTEVSREAASEYELWKERGEQAKKELGRKTRTAIKTEKEKKLERIAELRGQEEMFLNRAINKRMELEGFKKGTYKGVEIDEEGNIHVPKWEEKFEEEMPTTPRSRTRVDIETGEILEPEATPRTYKAVDWATGEEIEIPYNRKGEQLSLIDDETGEVILGKEANGQQAIEEAGLIKDNRGKYTLEQILEEAGGVKDLKQTGNYETIDAMNKTALERTKYPYEEWSDEAKRAAEELGVTRNDMSEQKLNAVQQQMAENDAKIREIDQRIAEIEVLKEKKKEIKARKDSKKKKAKREAKEVERELTKIRNEMPTMEREAVELEDEYANLLKVREEMVRSNEELRATLKADEIDYIDKRDEILGQFDEGIAERDRTKLTEARKKADELWDEDVDSKLRSKYDILESELTPEQLKHVEKVEKVIQILKGDRGYRIGMSQEDLRGSLKVIKDYNKIRREYAKAKEFYEGNSLYEEISELFTKEMSDILEAERRQGLLSDRVYRSNIGISKEEFEKRYEEKEHQLKLEGTYKSKEQVTEEVYADYTKENGSKYVPHIITDEYENILKEQRKQRGKTDAMKQTLEGQPYEKEHSINEGGYRTMWSGASRRYDKIQTGSITDTYKKLDDGTIITSNGKTLEEIRKEGAENTKKGAKKVLEDIRIKRDKGRTSDEIYALKHNITEIFTERALKSGEALYAKEATDLMTKHIVDRITELPRIYDDAGQITTQYVEEVINNAEAEGKRFGVTYASLNTRASSEATRHVDELAEKYADEVIGNEGLALEEEAYNLNKEHKALRKKYETKKDIEEVIKKLQVKQREAIEKAREEERFSELTEMMGVRKRTEEEIKALREKIEEMEKAEYPQFYKAPQDEALNKLKDQIEELRVKGMDGSETYNKLCEMVERLYDEKLTYLRNNDEDFAYLSALEKDIEDLDKEIEEAMKGYEEAARELNKNKELNRYYEGKASYEEVVQSIREAAKKDFKERYGSALYEGKMQEIMNEIFAEDSKRVGMFTGNIPMQELTADQATRAIQRYGEELDLFTLEKDIFDDFNVKSRAQYVATQSDFLNLYDRLTTLYKIKQTVTAPGFHVQNGISNAVQSYLVMGEQAFNPEYNILAYKILKGANPTDTIVLGGKTYKFRDLQILAEEAEIVSRTFGRMEVGKKAKEVGEKRYEIKKGKVGIGNSYEESPGNLFGILIKGKDSKRIKYAEGKKKASNFNSETLNKIDNIGIGLETTVARSQRIGQNLESTQRMSVFLMSLDNGDTTSKAIDNVNQAMFDYGSLTDFEQNVLKRVIPWYTFSKNNMALHLKTLITHPERLTPIAKWQNMANDEESESTPIQNRSIWTQPYLGVPGTNVGVNLGLPIQNALRYDFSVKDMSSENYGQVTPQSALNTTMGIIGNPFANYAYQLATGSNPMVMNEDDSQKTMGERVGNILKQFAFGRAKWMKEASEANDEYDAAKKAYEEADTQKERKKAKSDMEKALKGLVKTVSEGLIGAKIDINMYDATEFKPYEVPYVNYETGEVGNTYRSYLSEEQLQALQDQYINQPTLEDAMKKGTQQGISYDDLYQRYNGYIQKKNGIDSAAAWVNNQNEYSAKNGYDSVAMYEYNLLKNNGYYNGTYEQFLQEYVVPNTEAYLKEKGYY